MCSKEGRRIVLWMSWVINMLVTTVYYILCFATANYIVQGFNELNAGVKGSDVFKKLGVSNNIWRAPIASCVLGGILTLIFNLLGCIILLKKTINRGGPGFGYGFLTSFCFTISFFSLLCGLVLESFSQTALDQLSALPSWGTLQSGTYQACMGFAFLCFVMFLLFFLVLVIFQSAVSEQLGMDMGKGVPGGGFSTPPAFGQTNPTFGGGKAGEMGMTGMEAGGLMAGGSYGGYGQQQQGGQGGQGGQQEQEQVYGYGGDGGAYGGAYADPPPQAYAYGQQATGASGGMTGGGMTGGGMAPPAYTYGTATPAMGGQGHFGGAPGGGQAPPAYRYDRGGDDSVI